MTEFFIILIILSLFALAVFFLTILIAVIKIGPAGFSEAYEIQGRLRNVMEGVVDPAFGVSNDPRVVEGMTRDPNTRQYIRNRRLSDDYLKALFGA